MNLVGDYFTIGLVVMLGMFFFDGKHSLNKASRYFVASLILTGVTAALDIISVTLIEDIAVPMWLRILTNSLYFEVNILTTSFIGLYLFTKILEHSHSRYCMRNAQIGLFASFSIYTIFVIANIWTGWLFYFDGSGVYHRGPINGSGYVITILQMVLVVYCYVRNRRIAGRPMRRALLLAFPVGVLCIIIQRIIPSIMLNGLIMALVDTVLFLAFQGQRQGVHSLTQLNDRHRFFREAEHRLEHREYFRVYLINLKNFGMINQKHGHMFGDEALYRFAFSLENLFRDSMSFHMNGTVFAIIMPDMSTDCCCMVSG